MSGFRFFHFAIVFVALLVSVGVSGQDVEMLIDTPRLGRHGADITQPYGLQNPETAQARDFAFSIGHFERRERRRDPATGEWSDWGRGEKVGRWIMDGTAILDEHINYDSGEKVSFIRAFDNDAGRWHNVRVSLPDFFLTDAEGEFRGNEYYNESEFTDEQGRHVFQQYIFHEISDTGYKWRAQWTIEGQTFSYWEIEYSRKDSGSPYGNLHPQAPPETAQFEFMVGEFARRERRRNQDGTWQPWQEGYWNARYFMNGFGIIDESLNYETGVVTSNMRIFDPVLNQWQVTWLKSPEYGMLTAVGGMEGDEMVIVNSANGDRYVFSNISDIGYNWALWVSIDGQYVPVWEIECTRR